MNAFEKMVQDVFNVPEFVEYFYDENNTPIKTIAYSVNVEEDFTEYGVDNGVTFYLTCKRDDYAPKRGNKIRFRGETYKVANYSIDAFNLSYKIFLKSITSK